jgi:RNA polymerase sigma-70 factor (ECF subfamily)
MSNPATDPVDLFDDLVREHQAGLRAYVRALGAQDAWVDDIAQEVFLVAYRRRAAFIEGADVGRWLRGIARNLVLNERRKEARRSRLLHESLADVLLDEAVDEDTARLDVPRVLQAMRECVSALPPRHQELLHRRYAANENATLLGRAFGLGAAAVRQALVRSRATVKACVEGKLGEAWT